MKEQEFSSEGIISRGVLDAPQTSPTPHPLIIMAHGFGAELIFGLQPFVDTFVQLGFAVLRFDYRGFGISDGHPRQDVHPGRQIQDWQAAIAHGKSLPGIDSSRIALWGSSFSGGHVLAVAARDPTITAVIAQIPHTRGPATLFQKSVFDLCRATSLAARDLLLRALGKQPHRVPIVGKPNTFAAINTPDAWEGYHGMVPAESSFTNQVTALSLMRVPLYSPGKQARQIRCPVCIIAGERDAVTPFVKAKQTAAQIPDCEFHSLDCGHFDVYTPPTLEANLAIQNTFLKRRVLSPAS